MKGTGRGRDHQSSATAAARASESSVRSKSRKTITEHTMPSMISNKVSPSGSSLIESAERESADVRTGSAGRRPRAPWACRARPIGRAAPIHAGALTSGPLGALADATGCRKMGGRCVSEPARASRRPRRDPIKKKTHHALYPYIHDSLYSLLMCYVMMRYNYTIAPSSRLSLCHHITMNAFRT